MMLKNYYAAVTTLHDGGSAPFVLINGNVETHGMSSAYGWIKFSNIMTNIKTAYAAGGVVFGNGDTPPTSGDYKLSGDIITTISGSGAVTIERDENGVTYTSLFTITNTGNESVTIKEVGCMVNSTRQIMLERTVLDAPVTIPAGGVGLVTYTIRMNYPTA